MSSWTGAPTQVGLAIGSGGDLATWNNTNTWTNTSYFPGDNDNFFGALTYTKSGTRALYRNGVLLASATGSATLFATGGVIAIGIEDSSLVEDLVGRIYIAGVTTNIMSTDFQALMAMNWGNPLSFVTLA